MTEEKIKRILDKSSKIQERNFSSEQLDKLEEYIHKGILNLDKYNNINIERNTLIFSVVFLLFMLFYILFFVVHPILFIEQWTEQDVIKNKIRVETLKTIGLITGGILAFFGLYLGYIRAVAMENSAIAANKTAEVANKNAEIASRNTQIAEDKQITERFSKAVELLASDKIEVRLGGIYTLERIAKDSPSDHWTIMEVLTAFVRENAKLIEDSNVQSAKIFIDEYLDNKTQKKELHKVHLDIQETIIVIARNNPDNNQRKNLNLSNINLIQADLCGALLKEINLSRANFLGANLSNADLSGANCLGVNFSKADLSNANLSVANLFGANFEEARFSEANLTRADLVGANFTKAYLRGANLTEANLTMAKLAEACFTEVNFTKAHLALANISRSDLIYANLSEADLTKAVLIGSLLLGANLTETNLTEANLTEANLSGANLTEANLSGANLTRANLEEADFTNNKTIEPEQIKKATNWKKAEYDKDFCEKLGLPPENSE
ncbi:pentapeptide repeat-containing protein [Nostoc sp. FACHB-190]|uniref:pentapeptide repeat-containing protein n=1 Tax=Nostoc sp. FACHB-190 TaxID=2692838 RepID=UPI00168203B0|nr:pentapeptide repeat-containing protein [Nostoc sp. FACHB-190]MBD2300823.1 pentapeptide repeat-containing protein [Nostoc sp. FACHB-190]